MARDETRNLRGRPTDPPEPSTPRIGKTESIAMAEVRWSSQGLQVRCDGPGFAISGPGFHVWDERLPEALEQAALLRPHAPHERRESRETTHANRDPD